MPFFAAQRFSLFRRFMDFVDVADLNISKFCLLLKLTRVVFYLFWKAFHLLKSGPFYKLRRIKILFTSIQLWLLNSSFIVFRSFGVLGRWQLAR